jgi:hypothetical protein
MRIITSSIVQNQRYHTIQTAIEMEIVNGIDSYRLTIPYLKQLKLNNPRSEVHYVIIGHKIKSLFVCPSFMDLSLRFVRPVMSLDATHLKCHHKGTLYLATVKTGKTKYITLPYQSNVQMNVMMVGKCF